VNGSEGCGSGLAQNIKVKRAADGGFTQEAQEGRMLTSLPPSPFPSAQNNKKTFTGANTIAPLYSHTRTTRHPNIISPNPPPLFC